MIKMSTFYFEHFNHLIVLIKEFVHFFDAFGSPIIFPWIIRRLVADERDDLEKLLTIVMD